MSFFMAVFLFSILRSAFLISLNSYREYCEVQQTIYALTNQRAIILINLRSPVIESYPLETVQVSHWKEMKKDGSGDLVFETTGGKIDAFMGIPEVKKVVSYFKELHGNHIEI